MGENPAISRKKSNDSQTFSGVHFTGIHCLIGLVIMVLLVMGVAVLVYFATDRNNQRYSSAKPESKPYNLTEAQRWEKCKTQAKDKQCNIACPSSSNAYSTTKPTSRPFSSPHKTTEEPVTTPTAAPTPTDFRLPTNLYPTHYKLFLKPNIYGDDEKLFTFDGAVTIRFHCSYQTDVIVLHSYDLTYIDYSFSLTHSNGRALRISHHTLDKSRDFILFHAAEKLQPGQKYLLFVKFNGPLTRDWGGLYLTSYMRGNDTLSYVVASQLEPTRARSIFPCFDEPALKAVFQVSIARKANKISLSNMEITETRSMARGFVIDSYNDTVKMSTYLLAFVVCDFVNRTTVTSNGIQINVWTRPEYAKLGQTSLNYTARLLTYFAEFFKQPFPLRKLDMVAIPGLRYAMENWGLVIYDEKRVLFNNKRSPVSQKLNVAYIVAHELTHMWFGNLVTMEWWDDIWLNEGFAYYFAQFGMDFLEPTWKIFDRFRSRVSDQALNADSIKSSFPVYMYKLTAKTIYGVFNTIVYNKGAHVVRMMRYVLGDTHFFNGLRHYLNKHAYGNVNHTDLFQALSEISKMDVQKFIETWIKQKNYPLVHFRRVSSGGGGSNKVEISQARYLKTRNATESHIYQSPYGWKIPMKVMSNSPDYNSSNPNINWLQETHPKQTFPLPYTLKNKEWIIGNPDGNVYCRMNYDATNWGFLIQQLHTNHTEIPATDRINLIYDACDLSKASYIDITTCLDVLSYFSKEQHYAVLEAIFREIGFIDDMLLLRPLYGSFSALMKSKVSDLYDDVMNSENTTDPMEMQKLSLVSFYACYYGNEKCLKKMKDLFHAHNITKDETNPNLFPAMYCYGINQGNPEAWTALYESVKHMTILENPIFLSALACTDRVWQLNILMQRTLQDMTDYDIYTAMSGIARTSVGRGVAYNHVRYHWNEYIARLGKGSYYLRNLLKSVSNKLSTPSDLEKLKEFRNAHSGNGLNDATFTGHIKTVMNNIEWTNRNVNDISAWLKQYN